MFLYIISKRRIFDLFIAFEILTHFAFRIKGKETERGRERDEKKEKRETKGQREKLLHEREREGERE